MANGNIVVEDRDFFIFEHPLLKKLTNARSGAINRSCTFSNLALRLEVSHGLPMHMLPCVMKLAFLFGRYELHIK